MLSSRETAETQFQQALRQFNANDIHQLKSLPAKRFFKNTSHLMSDVLDHEFFLQDPETILKEGRFLSKPILLGTNADEFSMIELGITTNKKKLDTVLEKKYGNYAGLLKSELLPESSDIVDLQIKIMELLVFHNSAFRLLEYFSKKCPVYGYRLNYVPDLYNGLRGSYHGRNWLISSTISIR